MFAAGTSPSRIVRAWIRGVRDLISSSPSSPTRPSGLYPRRVPTPSSVRMNPTSSTGAWCCSYSSRAVGSRSVPRCISRLGWMYSTRPVMRSIASVSISVRLVSLLAILPVLVSSFPTVLAVTMPRRASSHSVPPCSSWSKMVSVMRLSSMRSRVGRTGLAGMRGRRGLGRAHGPGPARCGVRRRRCSPRRRSPPCADRGGGRTVAAIRQRSSVHFLHDSVGEVVAVNVAGPVLVQYGLDLLLGAGRLGEGGHSGMGENIGRHRLLGVQGTDRVGHPVAVLSDQLLDVVGGEGAGLLGAEGRHGRVRFLEGCKRLAQSPVRVEVTALVAARLVPLLLG